MYLYWKHPPIIKIYEALGALADKRIVVSENSAKVYSSSGNKFYSVKYDPATKAIMVNDNGSYYKGYLGYPAIVFLLHVGVLDYSTEVTEILKGLPWKDINVRFKNDFEKTLKFIFDQKSTEQIQELEREVAHIDNQLQGMKFKLLGKKIPPPEGY